ncbi:hypothetical protein ACOMHN_044499 [Nucella lapillus]
MMYVWVFCMAAFSYVSGSHPHKRVCYFSNWAQHRPRVAAYTVANVDPSLCTHLIYAFVNLDSQGQILSAFGEGSIPRTYARFKGLKTHNPELKTLVAVGGWNLGSKPFSLLAADPTSRRRFVTNVVIFLRQYGFDGLDLDWEFPGFRGGSAKDRVNLVLLCRELKEAFQVEATGTSQLIFSVSAPSSTVLVDVGYDIRALDRYVDMWNLMTSGYHGAWDGRTGHNSPLYAADNITWPQDTNSLVQTACACTFLLAFENSFCKDYVTEKVFNAYSDDLHVIPIVRGGADYSRILPPGTYVDTSDFPSPEALATCLIGLSKDHVTYARMLERKNM